MSKYLLLLLSLIVLSACSAPQDPLDAVLDISVPDRLSGCVTRGADGSCQKAVCVVDEGFDCKAWVKACKKFDHVADVRDGHDTCERATAIE